MAGQDDGVEVPAGFEPLFRTSPFLDLIGPLFYRKDGDGFVVGLRVLPKHANARGAAHGGLLLTLADVALGYRTAFSQTPPAALTTISMTADFTAAARVGDWVEVHVDIQRLGERHAFANAYLTVGDSRIVRASAVYARGRGSLTENSADV